MALATNRAGTRRATPHSRKQNRNSMNDKRRVQMVAQGNLGRRSMGQLFPLGLLVLLLTLVLFGTFGHAWAWPGSQNEHGFAMFPVDDCGNNNILLTFGPAFGWYTRGVIKDTEMDKLIESRHPGIFDLPFDDPAVEQGINEAREWLQRLWHVFEKAKTIE